MIRQVWSDVVGVLDTPKEKREPGRHRFWLELACGHEMGRHLLRPKGEGPDRVPCYRCTQAAE